MAPQWSAKVGLGRKQRNKCFYTVFGHGAPPKIVISALSCVFPAHSDSSELKKVTPAPLPMTGRRGAGVSEGPAPPMKWVQIDSARRVLSISIHFRSISITSHTRHHDVVLGSKVDPRITPRDCGASILRRILSLKMCGAPPKAQKKSFRDVVLEASTTSSTTSHHPLSTTPFEAQNVVDGGGGDMLADLRRVVLYERGAGAGVLGCSGCTAGRSQRNDQ